VSCHVLRERVRDEVDIVLERARHGRRRERAVDDDARACLVRELGEASQVD
jgi:hypothetical protein